MDRGLVDLSLFTMGPTNDDYIISEDAAPPGHRLHSSNTWPPSTGEPNRSLSPNPPVGTNKPLPRIPRKGLCDFVVTDTRATNRCILKRMRRVRLDAVLGERSLAGTPSAYATARSAYVNPYEELPPSPPPQQQTLQERRNAASIPQLTLPNTTTESRTQSGMPMIWLADEQMWLVADPSDPGYGYYATGPEDGMDEWLPPYTESEPTPNPNSSELSPVREQFRALMDEQRQRNRLQQNTNADDPRLSPLFQEAMQGISMLDFSDYQVPSERNTSRRDYSTLSSKPGQTQKQYIPYRSFPHINNHSQEKSCRSSSQRHSTQKKTDLYIPDLPTPPPSSGSANGISSISPSQIPPRSQSAALRSMHPQATMPTINYGKYASEVEIRRQEERLARRRGALERERMQRERSESCYSICSDSGVSTFSTATGGLEVGPEPGFWGVQRASSARH